MGGTRCGRRWRPARGKDVLTSNRVYELVNVNQAAAKVATLCRVLGVSARGCYA